MKPRKKVLENGMRIIVVPMKDNPTVTVTAFVEAGSHYETKENNGISHFLEHMFFKGTSKRPSPVVVANELDGMGASANAFTGEEYTGYYAKTRAKNFKKALDVISDMYLHSTLPEEEINKERGVIIEEINMYEDLPMRRVQEVLTELMYGDQPAGRRILGPKNNIKKFSREDFAKYRKEHYVAKKTVVIVAGKIDPEVAFAEIEKKFSGISEKPRKKKEVVKESQRSPQAKVSYKKSDQSHFILGFRSHPLGHKYSTQLDMLATILGRGFSSRLFRKLRGEMGVCYYARAYSEQLTDHGVFTIAAGVDNTRTHEVVSEILNEVRNIKKDAVSEEELNKAKEFTIGNFLMEIESSDQQSMYYGLQELLRQKTKTAQEVVKEIKKVTPRQIQKVAQDIFQNKNINFGIIGPFKNKKSFERVLKL